MLFFGHKRGASASAREDSNDDANLAGDSRRITLGLSRAGRVAAMLARSRASAVIEVSDLLAGMYISNWEHLSQYWEDEDQDDVEDWLRKFCAISPQRWNSWIELYIHEFRDGKSEKPWRGKKRDGHRESGLLQKSVALEDVLRQAEQIAPTYDRDGDRKLPILTTEAVLLCIARSYGTEISRKLASTAIDTTKLEKNALFPRRAPLA
ncbi:MAG: hypothetical protein KGL75_04365 [Acidobacteriota bacterium]|nr:hypothetical protein [Acidobacteriota bacterium]